MKAWVHGSWPEASWKTGFVEAGREPRGTGAIQGLESLLALGCSQFLGSWELSGSLVPWEVACAMVDLEPGFVGALWEPGVTGATWGCWSQQDLG